VRVIFSTSFENNSRALSTAAEALADAQRQVASGRRVAVPSDDPLATASAITGHAAVERIDAYHRATDAAAYRLGLADAVLTDVVMQLQLAQTIALAARGSTAAQVVRNAAASELLAIRTTLMADITTKFEGVYLFSGSRATDVPYEMPAGATGYQGDTAPANVEVAPGRSVSSTFDGSALLQGGEPEHVLDVLSDLAAAITAGDEPAVSAALDAVARAFDRATAFQARIGQDLRTADDVRQQLSARRVDALARLSTLEDANLAEAAAKMAQAETAYRAALSAMAGIGRLSLMDYLR
jgi:flagellar hook-associated protein 3 FlgL